MNLAGDRTQLYLEEAVANENEEQGHKKYSSGSGPIHLEYYAAPYYG